MTRIDDHSHDDVDDESDHDAHDNDQDADDNDNDNDDDDDDDDADYYDAHYDDDDELASQSLVFGYVHPGTKLRGDGKTNARDHLVLNGTLAFVFRKRKRLQELAKDDSKSSHGDMLADA